MDTVDVASAKTQLDDLIARASKGEDVCIVSPSGAVRLVPAQVPTRIIFGQWKHLHEIPEERLLAPLTDEELEWLSGENSAID